MPRAKRSRKKPTVRKVLLRNRQTERLVKAAKAVEVEVKPEHRVVVPTELTTRERLEIARGWASVERALARDLFTGGFSHDAQLFVKSTFAEGEGGFEANCGMLGRAVGPDIDVVLDTLIAKIPKLVDEATSGVGHVARFAIRRRLLIERLVDVRGLATAGAKLIGRDR